MKFKLLLLILASSACYQGNAQGLEMSAAAKSSRFSDNFCVFESPFYLEVGLLLSAFLPAKTLTTKIVREGSSTVGFSSQIEIDRSRPSTTGEDLGRIIQINIWYPGQLNKDVTPLEFLDYLKVKNHEMGIEKAAQDFTQTMQDYLQWPISQGANKPLLDSIFSAKIPMNALKDINFAPGKHPVILLMHGSAVDFAFLGEHLAKQGYVAINVPDKGYAQKGIEVNGIGMETEIRDYEFALSVLSGHSSIDLSTVIALGFSFGGQSALGLACRNPKVKMVISYDGGIGDKFGARLITEDPFCATESIKVPILHIYDASYQRNYLDKIRSFVHSERTMVGLDQIAHWHFTSFGYLASKTPHFFGDKEYATNGYATILGITEHYLRSRSNKPNTPYHLPKDEFDLVNKVESHLPLKIK